MGTILKIIGSSMAFLGLLSFLLPHFRLESKLFTKLGDWQQVIMGFVLLAGCMLYALSYGLPDQEDDEYLDEIEPGTSGMNGSQSHLASDSSAVAAGDPFAFSPAPEFAGSSSPHANFAAGDFFPPAAASPVQGSVASGAAGENPFAPPLSYPAAAAPLRAQPVQAQPWSAPPASAQAVPVHPAPAHPLPAPPVMAQPVPASPLTARPVFATLEETVLPQQPQFAQPVSSPAATAGHQSVSTGQAPFPNPPAARVYFQEVPQDSVPPAPAALSPSPVLPYSPAASTPPAYVPLDHPSLDHPAAAYPVSAYPVSEPFPPTDSLPQAQTPPFFPPDRPAYDPQTGVPPVPPQEPPHPPYPG